MKYIGKAAIGRAESMAKNKANNIRENVSESMRGRRNNEINWK